MNEDLGKQLSQILADKNIDLNQILDNLKANTTEETTQIEEEPNPFSQIDTETILKFQKIFNLMNTNKNTQDENLLKAIKPYMRDSRKEKIDKYIKLLHIFKLLEKFQEMGGNINDFL